MTLFKKTLANYRGLQLTQEHSTKLKERLAKVEPLYETFNNIQNEIEILTFDSAELYAQEIKEREIFQDSFLSLVTQAKFPRQGWSPAKRGVTDAEG